MRNHKSGRAARGNRVRVHLSREKNEWAAEIETIFHPRKKKKNIRFILRILFSIFSGKYFIAPIYGCLEINAREFPANVERRRHIKCAEALKGPRYNEPHY